jgi:hypothetical protein
MVKDRQEIVARITRLADVTREIVLECDPLSSWANRFWETGLVPGVPAKKKANINLLLKCIKSG